MQDDPLEYRAAGDAEHWFREVVGQRAETSALATGHDHRPVRADDRLEEFVEQVQPDGSALVIEHGDCRDPAGAHELESLGASFGDRDRGIVAHDDAGDRVRKAGAVQQGPPNIAIGHDPREPAVPVDNEADPSRASIERCHRIPDRSVLIHEARLEATHPSSSGAEPCGRAGEPTTSVSAGTSSTTTAPMPIEALAPTDVWSRTTAPSPTKAFGPIVAPPPIATRGPTWTKSPSRTSCSITAPVFTMTCRPMRAPALTMAPPSTTLPSSSVA